MSISIKLTVFFEDPFWVGVFERSNDGTLEVCRVVFGSEPKDYEVYDYVLRKYNSVKFSSPLLKTEEEVVKKVNPKRLQRQIKKYQKSNGTSTKSQEALRLAKEENKIEKKIRSKEQKDFEKKIKFQQKQEKKKKKRKGH